MSFLSGVLAFLSALGSYFAKLLRGDFSGAAEETKKMLGLLGEFFDAIFGDIKDSISKKVGEIKEEIVTGITEAVEWIKGLPEQGVQGGDDIIQGNVEGINGAMSKEGDAVSGVEEKIRSYLHFSVPYVGP